MADFKPWRESVIRLRRHITAEDIAGRDREDEATLLAIDVFGNYDEALFWMTRLTSLFGGWHQPRLLAMESPEGLSQVKAVLWELRKTVPYKSTASSNPSRRRPSLYLIRR